MKRFADENNLELNIERIKLAKTLRKVMSKKIRDE